MSAPIVPKATLHGVPIHAMLVPFPIVCFVAALLTDIAYANSANIQWTNFSQWLLAFGTLFAGIAAVFGMIDFFFGTRGRDRPTIGWIHMIANLVLFVVALFNNFVHARDGWTSVVPTGLTLSIITVLLLLVSGHLGGRLAYQHVATGDRR
ncbi:membrane protein [Tsuneonella deserti]|uniref:Membrane protein n=1 Tax=Tsuneonella deserti TaxID=2035528 RepID=A0ABQ1SCS8_9SPHN|nr:DUF2231 domain-containing protein [Tsuneonella deserti]GGE05697.1 membrane protein [Tsuneonella deserti]